MIGGSDKVLWVDETAPASELILRVVRRHWPSFVYQDAEADEPLGVAESSSLTQPARREFFLFRSSEAAQDWRRSGATDDNKNTLIHVILGNRRKPDLPLRSLTLVGGEWVGELAAIAADIQTAFDGVRKHPPFGSKEAPARSPVG